MLLNTAVLNAFLHKLRNLLTILITVPRERVLLPERSSFNSHTMFCISVCIQLEDQPESTLDFWEQHGTGPEHCLIVCMKSLAESIKKVPILV
jgi:hypothetical protein